MKKKMSLFLSFMLCLMIVPFAHASQPVIREITHEVIDGEMDEMYVKGVMHGVLIGRVIGDMVRAKVSMTQKLNIHELIDGEAGEFLAVVNLHLNFEGTVESNEELEMLTGTYTGTWVIVVLAEVELPIPEDATLKGHITRIYRDGVVVKEIIKGVPPFPMP